ncbi:hypothetical protein NZL82_15355 [Sphingomonas sanguinis]|uniref:hypothetical protein n=1 Tax=Sphingomonas sp. LC-1 TaxID=3110957 RepID=UPI0021BA65FD|nr:hypothetical protein [Sphingomonas sp. LC-1]MCT8003252.1 hypothetical protein [Sphingomonas sp. LC-1]
MTWGLVPMGEPVTLNACPPGPFEFNGSIGFRSEYATTLEDPRRYQVDAYCFESGEYFWGGASGTEARARLVVQPLALSTLSADAIRQGEGISIPDDLREAARYASDGPWEIDSERNEDGAYGSGPDHGTGYDDYIILDAEGRTLFGSENSTAKLIEEEYSEDDVYVWDQVGKRNAAFIVAAVNFVRKMLATPASHASDGGKAA